MRWMLIIIYASITKLPYAFSHVLIMSFKTLKEKYSQSQYNLFSSRSNYFPSETKTKTASKCPTERCTFYFLPDEYSCWLRGFDKGTKLTESQSLYDPQYRQVGSI